MNAEYLQGGSEFEICHLQFNVDLQHKNDRIILVIGVG